MVKIINESENKFEELFRIQHRGIKEMEKRKKESRDTADRIRRVSNRNSKTRELRRMRGRTIEEIIIENFQS